jgi:DMSO reductase anchor subunit
MYFIHVALMLSMLSGESKFKKLLGWLIAVIGTFGLIVCRLHYTSDVILAWVNKKKKLLLISSHLMQGSFFAELVLRHDKMAAWCDGMDL